MLIALKILAQHSLNLGYQHIVLLNFLFDYLLLMIHDFCLKAYRRNTVLTKWKQLLYRILYFVFWNCLIKAICKFTLDQCTIIAASHCQLVFRYTTLNVGNLILFPHTHRGVLLRDSVILVKCVSEEGLFSGTAGQLDHH